MKTGCLGHSFWAPFIQDTLRQQTFFAFLLPSSKHQLGVWFLLTFSESSLTRRLNESSVHCLSGLSCAALYANPHTLKLGDKCEPHALWISFFRSIFLCFFCLFSDRSCTIGIAFYVITSPVKKTLEFPKYLLFVLVHTHATPTHSKSCPAFFRSWTIRKSFNVGTFLKTESLHAPSLWQIPCIPAGLIHLGCK